MNPTLVVDAQPLVALLLDEPSAPLVAERLGRHAGVGSVVVSAVNWCEVLYATARAAGPATAARAAGLLEAAGVRVVEADPNLAGYAAAVKAEYGLSLGDSFAAGLAMALGAPLLTGDSDFQPLAEHGLEIEWVG